MGYPNDEPICICLNFGVLCCGVVGSGKTDGEDTGMITRKFDRLVRFDERSREFPIRALVSKSAKPRSYTWSCPVCLDQGSEGACTGFAVSQEAAARPVKVTGITNAVARKVYKRAQQLDEWKGEDYEGSSVLGAMKAGQELGWYTEYRWAFGEEDLALAIGYKGPAVLGVNWYEGMGNADKDGLIHITGRLLGGHAILCNGYNHRKRIYRLHNSWGDQWGRQGDCFITAEDMMRLLSMRGEACIPVVRKKGVKK
jgi:hypothetical protein